MRVADFHFDLPEDLIAQTPPAVRGSSRMLAVNRATGALTDGLFADLPNHLRPGDLLILNDSRVLPARLYAHTRRPAHAGKLPRPLTARSKSCSPSKLAPHNLVRPRQAPAKKSSPAKPSSSPRHPRHQVRFCDG